MIKISSILCKFCVNTQLWVSTCVLGLCLFFQEFNHQFNLPLLGVIFFSTLGMYNLAYYIGQKAALPKILMTLGTLISIVLAGIYLSFYSCVFLLFLGGLSFFYSVPVSKVRLRELPGVKIFLIAFVWASVVVLLPKVENGLDYEYSVFMQFLVVYTFILGITIPFDVRDLEIDNPQLITLPQIMGKKNAIYLGLFLLLVSQGLFLGLNDFSLNEFSIAYSITVFCALFLVRLSLRRRTKLFTTFWVEGLSLLPSLLCFFISKIG